MTYIIAEPCIDIKDRSCVDVCPVDCIHEAGRILVIDPEECIDCFAPDETLITSYGVKTFAELENQPCPDSDRRRVQAGAGEAVPRQAAGQAPARPGVRGARPLRRHAVDDAQHLEVPAHRPGDAHTQLDARRRRSGRTRSKWGSSCRRCGSRQSARTRATGSASCTDSSTATGRGTGRTIRDGEHVH